MDLSLTLPDNPLQKILLYYSRKCPDLSNKMVYKSTPKEREVMKECTQEAFLYRAMPSAILAGMYLGNMMGHIIANGFKPPSLPLPTWI